MKITIWEMESAHDQEEGHLVHVRRNLYLIQWMEESHNLPRVLYILSVVLPIV